MRLETSVSKMGFRSPYVGRLTMSFKNIEFSKRFSIFEGADSSDFGNHDFYRFAQCILYSFWNLFHCSNDDFFGRSKCWFMSRLHFLWTFFYNWSFGSKKRFFGWKNRNPNRIEPEPARTGADRNRTEPNRTVGFLEYVHKGHECLARWQIDWRWSPYCILQDICFHGPDEEGW